MWDSVAIFTFVTVTFKCLWNLLMSPVWVMNLVTGVCVCVCFFFFFVMIPLEAYRLYWSLFGRKLYSVSEVKVTQLCPTVCSPWNSPDQNTGMGSLSLLQQIFLTQELNQGILHCRQIIYQMSYPGSSTFCNKLKWERMLKRHCFPNQN